MKVISVNIGKKKTVKWQGKAVETGIFKFPVSEAIFLGTEDVVGDDVIDRKYHGGVDKACYAYGAEAYHFWEPYYPEATSSFGAFGENLTIENFLEEHVFIGDHYQIGDAIVEVSQPRQPCMKLGIRFENQKIVKDFINAPYPGAYLRILKEGFVQKGDKCSLIHRPKNSISLAEVHSLFGKTKAADLAQKAIATEALAESCRIDLKRIYSL